MSSLWTEVWRFVCAGTVYTLFDLLVFNLLLSKPFSFGEIKANCISTTFTLLANFFINNILVFQSGSRPLWERALLHAVVTLISSYGIQSIVIYCGAQAFRIIRKRGKWYGCSIDQRRAMILNSCKCSAIAVGAIWNFCLYKLIVFV